MKLTIEHLLDLIEAVPANVAFDYVKANNKTKAKLISVGRSEPRVEMGRIAYKDGNVESEDSSSLIGDSLKILSHNIREGKPFSIDKVFNNGGNMRSVCEAILARTTEFYKVMVGRNKNLVWLPEHPHTIGELTEITAQELKSLSTSEVSTDYINDKYRPYLTALQTKPFMLLAGISGTGKSRIVRELSFMTCPKYLQDKDGTTPGNYCMIEVKPNWHDSTELLGYWSNINNKYIFPKFIKFLVKAKMFPKIPFFVCLDEMNLAPVEQYFAEVLSILETRKHPKKEDGTADNTQIKTSCIVDSQYFTMFASDSKLKNVEDGTAFKKYKNDREIYMALHGIETEDAIDPEVGNKTTLFDEGLTLPDNVFIVGTVNMDDTTHQFSRKVIDRAMTIEMNGGDLVDIFDSEEQLSYREESDVVSIDKVWPKYTTADEAVRCCETIANNESFLSLVKGRDEDGELIKNGLPQRLESINKTLVGTPFTVSYRVMNELVILLAVLLDEAVASGEEIDEEKFSVYMDTAIDRILLMKILPRVEGDDEMFRVSAKERKVFNLKEQINADGENVDYTKLDWLRDVAPQRPSASDDEQESDPIKSYMAIDKLDEMIERLRRQNFTRYWP